MPESSPPLIVSSPAALHAAVDSATITPSDTLLLRPLRAKIENLSGIRVTANDVGADSNGIGFEIVTPTNESTSIIAEEVDSGAKITLAASGTRGVLNVQGIRLESVVKGTDANDISIELINPGTALASPSVSVDGTDITLNLGTDAGAKAALTNQGIIYNAVTPGTGGNSITVALVNPGTPSAALSVGVASSAISVNLATDAGTAQVETATGAGTVASNVAQVETATAAGNVSTSGNATVTVTAAGMTNSPKAISVAVLNTDDDGSAIATKIRAALTADEDVAAFFTVSGATDQIILTRLTAAVNDATLNIAIADGTSVGVTTAATSANTTAGLIGGGNASIVVTGAGITGSPLTIPVAVASGDTPALWVEKVRVAIAATAAITALYSVGGTGADITLTELVPNGNDGTLNIAIATGTATGITTAATSTNTVAGVAPAIVSTRQQVALAVNASLTARALVTAVDPGTSTVVTAVGATNLTGGGDNPQPSTTREQALAVLVAESDVTDLVSVFVNDTNPLYNLVAADAAYLTGGSVTVTSTVEDVVNALAATTANNYCSFESQDALIGSSLIYPTDGVIETSGGAGGQWSIDSSFTRALSVNVSGDVAYLPYNSDTVVVATLAAGQMYPISARAVKETDTTATGIVGYI